MSHDEKCPGCRICGVMTVAEAQRLERQIRADGAEGSLERSRRLSDDRDLRKRRRVADWAWVAFYVGIPLLAIILIGALR